MEKPPGIVPGVFPITPLTGAMGKTIEFWRMEMKDVISNFRMKPATLVAMVLLCGCVTLLQWHSVRFWSDHVDPTTGWAWSLLLEAVGLWLWYRRGWINLALAGASSLLLLVGPLYVVSEPAVTRIMAAREAARTAQAQAAASAHAEEAAVRARAEAVPALERSIEALERQMEVFLENSQERSGWLPAIERTQADLAERRRALADLYAPKTIPRMQAAAPPDLDLAAVAVVLMQCLALVLYQVTGVLALRYLSAGNAGDAGTGEAHEKQTVCDSETPNLRALPGNGKTRPVRLVMY